MNRLLKFTLGLLFLTSPALAGIDFSFKKPEDANRLTAENPSLYGFYTSSAVVTLSTAGKQVITLSPNNADQFGTAGRQWVTGAGVLEDIFISTGATSVYVVCMDSAGTSNTTLNDLGWSYLYPPTFANTTNAARAFGSVNGGVVPPIAFRNGLWCWSNGTTTAVRWWPVWRAKGD